MSVNKAFLVGRLGNTPSINYSTKGVAFATFRMATNERRKDSEGNLKEHTEWHSVVTFGRLAELCVQYLAKGRQVLVEGSIRTSSWEDEEKNSKFRTEIIASNVEFLGSRVEKDEQASVSVASDAIV